MVAGIARTDQLSIDSMNKGLSTNLMAHLSNKRIQLVTRWGNLIRITPLSGTNIENNLNRTVLLFLWNQLQTFIHKNWYVQDEYISEIKDEYAVKKFN